MKNAVGHDLAKDPGLELSRLEALLNDIEQQPTWRDEAQRAAAYYDGKQLEPHVIQTLKDRGQAPLVFNLIAPTIDAVLGIEAKTRTSWLVRPDNDESLQVAEGMNEKLNEASRLTLAEKACSDAYAAQVKTGLGWVETNRNSNPFDYKYRCQYVNRNEIHWDWHAKRADLRDARYLVRDRWLDEDRALLAFPEHELLIKQAVNGWARWNSIITSVDYENMISLGHAYSEYQQTVLDEDTWWDTDRERVRVFEVWYRKYQKGVVLQLQDGRVIEYDKENAIHKAALAHGMATPISGVFPKMRLAYFLGCHRVVDVPSPLPHDDFPYVPFWGFREDGTGIPYGLIRRMMSPQDEVNARRAKMMWLLSAKRVIMDSDATKMDVEEVADEIQRPDGVVILNPSRQNRDQYAFRVEQDFQLAAQQFEIMIDAQKQIQDTAGVYSALMGRQEAGGAESGVAIASLVEQGSTTLAELNDNYRFARRLVGEQLMSFLIKDIDKTPMDVAINVNKPQRTKIVQINQPTIDEDGNRFLTNDLTRAKMQVALDDIQSTAGYRAQIANRLFELASTLPDEIKVAVLDVVVDATDIPQREEIVKRIRQVTGQYADPSEMTDEERQQYEAKQALEQETQQLALEELRGRVAKVKADASKSMASSGKVEAEAGAVKFKNRKLDAETDLILAQMQQLTMEMHAMQQQLNEQIETQSAQISAYEKVLPDLLKFKATAPPKSTKPGGGGKPSKPAPTSNPMMRPGARKAPPARG